MAVSSITSNFDAYASSVLHNLVKGGAIQDQISTANNFFYQIIKKKAAYEAGGGGDRCRVSLMYELGSFDVYSGYDQLDVTPKDGMTAAFYDWGQMSTPISISGKEERENAGNQTQVFDLLKGKTTQAIMGIKEGFAKAFVQGNGPNSATAVTTAFTSVNTGAVFISPLLALVHPTPSNSFTVGNINQSTYSWWRNQMTSSTATNYSGFLKEMDHLYNSCSKGINGSPDIILADQNVYELITAAYRSQNQYVTTAKADIPFDNINFKGNPVTWDEFLPDANNGTVTGIPVAASGTLMMLNSAFFGFKYLADFQTGPFVKPENQDAKTAVIIWHGASYCSNRRKQGVLKAITTTLTA